MTDERGKYRRLVMDRNSRRVALRRSEVPEIFEGKPHILTSAQMVREVCEVNNDCASIIKLVGLMIGRVGTSEGNVDPAAAAYFNAKAYREVVQGIEGYFKNRGVAHKLLVPEGKEGTSEFQAFYDDYEKLIQNMSAIGDDARVIIPPTVGEFIKDVGRALAVEHDPDTARIVRIVAGREKIHSERSYKEVTQSYNEILNLTVVLRRPDFKAEEAMKVPERIASIAEGAAHFHVEGIPTIWTTKFGGVALRDLVRDQSQDTFTTKALRYLSHIPPGDYFWQQFAEAFFFTHPLEPIRAQTEDFTQPLLARNILGFKIHMVNELLLPTVTNTENRKFDDDLRAIMERMSSQNTQNLSTYFLSILIQAPHNLQIFYPQVRVRQAAAAIPLYQLIYESERGVLFMDLDLVDFLQRHKNNIEEGLKRRFGITHQGHTLIRTFLGAIDKFNPAHGGPAIVKERLDNAEDLLHSPEDSPRIAKLAFSNNLYHELTFADASANGITRNMQLQHVIFEVHPDAQGEVRFLLNFEEGFGYIGGVIEADGGIRFVNFDPSLSERGEELKDILTGIVKISYRDLQEQLQPKQSEGAPIDGESVTKKSDPRGALERLESYFIVKDAD